MALSQRIVSLPTVRLQLIHVATGSIKDRTMVCIRSAVRWVPFAGFGMICSRELM